MLMTDANTGSEKPGLVGDPRTNRNSDESENAHSQPSDITAFSETTADGCVTNTSPGTVESRDIDLSVSKQVRLPPSTSAPRQPIPRSIPYNTRNHRGVRQPYLMSPPIGQVPPARYLHQQHQGRQYRRGVNFPHAYGSTGWHPPTSNASRNHNRPTNQMTPENVFVDSLLALFGREDKDLLLQSMTNEMHPNEPRHYYLVTMRAGHRVPFSYVSFQGVEKTLDDEDLSQVDDEVLSERSALRIRDSGLRQQQQKCLLSRSEALRVLYYRCHSAADPMLKREPILSKWDPELGNLNNVPVPFRLHFQLDHYFQARSLSKDEFAASDFKVYSGLRPSTLVSYPRVKKLYEMGVTESIEKAARLCINLVYDEELKVIKPRMFSMPNLCSLPNAMSPYAVAEAVRRLSLKGAVFAPPVPIHPTYPLVDPNITETTRNSDRTLSVSSDDIPDCAVARLQIHELEDVATSSTSQTSTGASVGERSSEGEPGIKITTIDEESGDVTTPTPSASDAFDPNTNFPGTQQGANMIHTSTLPRGTASSVLPIQFVSVPPGTIPISTSTFRAVDPRNFQCGQLYPQFLAQQNGCAAVPSILNTPPAFMDYDFNCNYNSFLASGSNYIFPPTMYPPTFGNNNFMQFAGVPQLWHQQQQAYLGANGLYMMPPQTLQQHQKAPGGVIRRNRTSTSNSLSNNPPVEVERGLGFSFCPSSALAESTGCQGSGSSNYGGSGVRSDAFKENLGSSLAGDEFSVKSYARFRQRCLEDRALHGPGHSQEMNKLYRFWSYFLRKNLNRNMYEEFRQLARDDVRRRGDNNTTGHRYGLECLFRMYSYGLELKFRRRLYQDLQEEVLDDLKHGDNRYGLEKLWALLYFSSEKNIPSGSTRGRERNWSSGQQELTHRPENEATGIPSSEKRPHSDTLPLCPEFVRGSCFNRYTPKQLLDNLLPEMADTLRQMSTLDSIRSNNFQAPESFILDHTSDGTTMNTNEGSAPVTTSGHEGC